MAQDRVVKGASDGRLYRVLAGEAHSWDFLLIEDQLGERFKIDTRTRALVPISDADAQTLLETRAFRQWSGSSLWASLNDLPLAPTPPAPVSNQTAPGIEPPASPPDALADA